MFTGIIENSGIVKKIQHDQSNIHFTIESSLASELKIDQSVAHNGCCLTVVEVNNNTYTVTAIQETLNKTNLKDWVEGTNVNLERCTKVGSRLDGHIVQGHVDTTAKCVSIEDLNGSIKFTFSYTTHDITVQKGSITVNGVSLTVVDSDPQQFSVCIIPYTLEHTNFKFLKTGDFVNIEFDIIGKYVARFMDLKK
ncbi:MAG TPA: riboflavin synthase [Fluviicola sp.]|nr:riboflavin synthase [Fluviicola sp.]